MVSKIVNWIDFVRFITDTDLWSRWTYQVPMNDDGTSPEQYFLEALAAAQQKQNRANFDFDKTEIQVTSKDESMISWEHDGESLYYFFSKWCQGVRL
jgi:hypothetical protein